MRKLILIFFYFLSCISFCYAHDEIITTFLTEYIDGKATGRTVQLELHMFNNKQWFLYHITIDTDEYDKITILQAWKANSEDKTDWPWLKKIDWLPGKRLSCEFLPDGAHYAKFTAVKVSNTQYGWNVTCKGKIKMNGTINEYKEWEWKSSREFELKYKKLKFDNLFNQ